MSTHPGPHLDDDALSAHLDGFDAGGAAEHLAACADCRARSDSLAAAAALIGVPPAPPPGRLVDEAVAQALDAESRGARRPMLVALAAAAVVVLGVVGAAMVGDEKPASRSDTAALGGGTADEDAATGAGEATGNGLPVAEGGDLGTMDDPNALSARVQSVVEPAPAAAQTGGGGGGESATTARTSSARALSDGSKREPEDLYCRQAVADEYDTGLGALVYRATLRWNGTDAVAVAYALAEPKGELDHRLFVLAEDSCQLLVAQTF